MCHVASTPKGKKYIKVTNSKRVKGKGKVLDFYLTLPRPTVIVAFYLDDGDRLQGRVLDHVYAYVSTCHSVIDCVCRLLCIIASFMTILFRNDINLLRDKMVIAATKSSEYLQKQS